jgi:hypothetical protein
MILPGKMVTPLQAIGSCQPKNVSPATDRYTITPDWQTRLANANQVAHRAISYESTDATIFHACAEDIAEDADVAQPRGIDHGDAALGHFFDRAPCRPWRGERLRRRKILPGGNEAHGEGAADGSFM